MPLSPENPTVTQPARALFRRLFSMTLRDLLFIGIPMLVLVAAGFWGAWQFVRPAPPRHLVLATGSPEGAYHMHGARYRDELAKEGVEVTLRPTAGSIDNLKRLNDPDSGVDAAFLQSGTATLDDGSGLAALGTLYPEPLWVFTRGRALDTLDALKGRRLAIGAEGSGTRKLALTLLESHGLQTGQTTLLPLGGLAAAAALAKGEVDAVFAVGAMRSAAVWTLLYTPGARLMHFSQAEAYARRLPYLRVVTLPRGTIDLERNLPERDIALVAPTAQLVAREDLHPALGDLLLQAAHEIHGDAEVFQKAGEFPNAKGTDIPLSREAERYYRNGKPFLQRYLPFWAATLIDRMIVLLVPIVAILLPLIKIAPGIYAWRVRSRVFRYYGELKLLEYQAQQDPTAKTRQEWLAELDRIEEAAHRLATPVAFANDVYTLREHVHMVRQTLLRRLEETPVPLA